VQYVVSLLFAAICYFIYSYVAVCTFCCSTLCLYCLLLFVILFTVMSLYVCSVQYVVSLLFAAICYFIYSYVAVCMFCAVQIGAASCRELVYYVV
jgi:hypothetical protein